MGIDAELAQASIKGESALTIGVFDGVHRGHQRLISQVVNLAAAKGYKAGVVTFRNHPDSVFNPDFEPQYITSVPERIRLIEQLGVDFVAPITFDKALAGVRARAFVERLQRSFGMRALVVGPDFAMGYRREGDVNRLAVMGADLGFSVSVTELLADDGDAVSSTSIRRALAAGDVVDVAKKLGRNFAISGVVVSGEKRGRTLGFPTANLEVDTDMAVPRNGIYATRAYVGDKVYMAATSIGTRPTFDGTGRTIEAFLLGFDNILYNRQLRLEFVQRLRDELRFDSVEALLERMELDVEQTRAILQASK